MAGWNDNIIAEFRANDGKVGGPFEGAHLLLLTTTGAKTGQERIAPMVYFEGDGTYYVIASKAGAPTHPDWFHNLVANPTVHVDRATGTGIDSFDATAATVTGARRDELYAEFSASRPGFGAYQEKTDRVIPIVELHRVA
ncbi:MAG: nitroreductase family deazaflavin-dependent oxidoreductase [Rhodoglobus sp.]